MQGSRVAGNVWGAVRWTVRRSGLSACVIFFRSGKGEISSPTKVVGVPPLLIDNCGRAQSLSGDTHMRGRVSASVSVIVSVIVRVSVSVSVSVIVSVSVRVSVRVRVTVGARVRVRVRARVRVRVRVRVRGRYTNERKEPHLTT